ncbi:MAG TPA: molybdenum cofactor guanylyltransferase [Nitrospiraceae bacterium]|nr:molybdenum cofactor guanylyltransferase [Nitrospiraceae bacterium]
MSAFIKHCTGVILAGGENTRMPVLKAFIEVEGQRIIEKNIGTMKMLFKDLCIVTNQPGSYSYLGVPMLGDVYNIRGPMTGILTALLNSPNPRVFISACDMPFLNRDLIEYMAIKVAEKDAVVPVLGRNPEPLFAFYSRHLLGPMEKAVQTGRNSMRDFLRNKRVKYITIDEIKKIDTRGTSFVNLNSPEDIERYLRKKDIIRFKRTVKREVTCLD